MRLLIISFCFSICMGCSLGLGFDDDLNADYQYTNLMAKFEPTAEHTWSFVLDPNIQPIAIEMDSLNNTVIVGSYVKTPDLGGGALASGGTYGLFAAKYDPDGEHVWSRGFGELFANAVPFFSAVTLDVVLDDSDNIVITGSFATETTDFGGGPLPYDEDGEHTDVFLAKLDSNGDYLFAKSFDASGQDNEHGMAVATDSQGNIFLAGITREPLELSDGAEVEGSFLAGFDSDGELMWRTSLCEDSNCWDLRLSSSGAGDILLTGGHAGEIDLGSGPIGDDDNSQKWGSFAALFNTDGDHLWSTGFGLSRDLNGFPGCVSSFDSAGNMVVAGSFETDSSSSGSYALFVTKMDQTGAHLWDVVLNLDTDHYATNTRIGSLVLDLEDNVVLSGLFMGRLAVGNNPPVGQGDDGDAFILKLDSGGTHLWSIALERAIPASTKGLEYSLVTAAADIDSSNNIVFASGSPKS